MTCDKIGEACFPLVKIFLRNAKSSFSLHTNFFASGKRALIYTDNVYVFNRTFTRDLYVAFLRNSEYPLSRL